MDLTEKALEVAGEGYPVFPCGRSKRPCWSNDELGVADGEGGLKIATRDPEEIKRLFAHTGAVLIGVPTGPASGIAVVDVDVKDGKSGQSWYDDHLAELGYTRWHRTKSGGVHLVYAINGLDPGSNAGVIHDGVDLRGGGGYIIWWPAHDCEYGDVELAPFPKWIARQTEELGEAWATLADDDLEQHIIAAESFHQPMVSLAWRMTNDGYSQGHIVDHLARAFDKSVAAKATHPRHKDWTRRKLDIFRTAASAIEKAGRAELPQQSKAEQVRGSVATLKPEPPALPAISDYPGRRFDATPAPELKTIIEGLVPAGRLCNVAGLGGSGKGILMQIAATCIPAGMPWLGRTVIRSPVAYYSCEDDDGVLHHRQARINDLLGLSATPEGLYIKSFLGHDLTMFNGKHWTAIFDWLWADLAKIERLGVVILDPASEFYIGEFADPVSVKNFCKRLDAECFTRGITLFLLMHTPKGDAKTPYGSVQWLNAARTTLMLDPVVDDEGAVDRRKAVLRVAKGNYIRSDEIPLIWTEDGLLVQKDAPDAYEQIERVKELETLILELCDTAWKQGAPLSDASQARERYLPARVRQAAKSKFSKREATQMMSDLMRVGKLKLGRTHDRRGLKVVKNSNE